MSRTTPPWRRYLRFWGPNPAADIDDELGFHITERTEELIARGLTPSEARAAAERELGDIVRVKSTVRALDAAHNHRQGLIERLEDLARDVRYAARALIKARTLSLVVIVTLALGIGVNSIIFSIINAYLFRPLPTPYAGRLAVMGTTDQLAIGPHEMSYPDYMDYRAIPGVFDDLAAYYNNTASLSSDGHPERVWVDVTTGNLFSALGIGAALGRTLLPTDGVTAKPSVIVLSYAYWKRRFNGDRRIVGDTIRVDGQVLTVVGVAREGFRGVSGMIQVDGWLPLDVTPAAGNWIERRDQGNFNIIGRLKSGVSFSQARAAVKLRAKQLASAYPKTNKDVDVVLVTEPRSRPVLTISGPIPLMAIVMGALAGLVLLVACANVASLLLARATSRQREIAVRAALGASRWRLVRQSLAESLLLAGAGAGCALALARWATSKLGDIRPATDAPVFFDFSLDWRVFAFTLGAALVTAFIAGIFPALRGATTAPQSVLAGGGRSNTDRRQHRLRGGLVVAQVAVSTIVLIAAGLFARSMRHALEMDLGFRTEHVLTSAIDLTLTPGYDSIRGKAFYRDVVEQVRRLPGVLSVTMASRIPFGYGSSSRRVLATQRTASIPNEGLRIFVNTVGLDYFRTLGPSIVHGRTFEATDDENAPTVAVVNEAMAKRLWPDEEALGKRFRLAETGEELQVIGVSRTAQYMSVGEEPRPFFYISWSQHYRPDMMVQLHTTGDPLALAQPLREIVRARDSNVPVFDLRTMSEHLRGGRALFIVRMGAIFGAAFGLLALTLAAVGVYGVVSYSVSSRTREIGIRMALGARMGAVLRMVVRQGIILCAIGVAVGIVGAAGITRLMSSLLYDVNPTDPTTFAVVAAALGLVAFVASFIPARRAAKVDPSTALRAD